ncbi:MAG: hypothetical protein KJN68_03490 [Bacteroidia bacterium]|nr:hypothetical protein [Bacteroidia bacterium]
MKTIQNLSVRSVLNTAVLVMFLLAFSCSSDTLLESEVNEGTKASSNSILKTLVKGAALNAANGIDIGPDGNLYIASVNGQEIVVMSKINGTIIDRIKEGVDSPDDLVFSSDGSALYWTDILTGFVGRLDMETGEVVKQFVAPGVNPITFSDEGRLFVALDFLGDGLYELDPNLIDPPRVIIEATPGNPFPLGFFNSFDFGEDGRLYGPLFAAGLVIAVNVGEPGDPVSTSPFTDGTAEIVSGGFVNPAAAKFGPKGMLYVLDQTGELFKIDPATGDKTLFTRLQPGLDNMTFDTDGSLYMTNNDEGWVAEILSSGQARILSTGGMIVPQGLAVMAGPNNQDVVFEADLFSLREFNGTSGQQENQYKGFLVPPPGVFSLTLPMNVSASGSDLVISSFFTSTVQIWNPHDGVIADYADQVAAPIDAVRLDSGEVIVSDLGLGGVYRMSDAFQITPLVVASGMATDGETVWVADWATGDIVQIDFDGGSTTSAIVASGLSFPEGLAVDHEGRILVYETKGPVPSGVSQLSRIDLITGVKTIIVEDLKPKEGGLPGFPPMWFFDGVDVGPSGDIYIRGGEENVIYRIKKNKIK